MQRHLNLSERYGLITNFILYLKLVSKFDYFHPKLSLTALIKCGIYSHHHGYWIHKKRKENSLSNSNPISYALYLNVRRCQYRLAWNSKAVISELLKKGGNYKKPLYKWVVRWCASDEIVG